MTSSPLSSSTLLWASSPCSSSPLSSISPYVALSPPRLTLEGTSSRFLTDVAGWVKDMQTLLTTIDPANNVPILWDQFLVEFERNFQDTAKADKARTAIQNFQMKGDDVDAY